MAFYRVVITAQVDMLVKADSPDEALGFAVDDVDFGRAGVTETSAPELLETEESVERARRHADQISEP